jgi:hypothetical protein
MTQARYDWYDNFWIFLEPLEHDKLGNFIDVSIHGNPDVGALFKKKKDINLPYLYYIIITRHQADSNRS